MKRKTVTTKKIREGLDELIAINAKTEAIMAETAKEQRLWLAEQKVAEAEREEKREREQERAAQAERDRKSKLIGDDIDKRIKAVTKQMGGMANIDGNIAEEYFANALADKMEFAGQHFDFVDRNLHRKRKDREDEFDILMYNGMSIGLIEIKKKATLQDVENLVKRKLENFRVFFPEYVNHKVYLGLGSMSFDEKVLAKATELGIGTLRRKGRIIESDTTNIRPY
jgi:hypothetical protein